MDILRFLPVIVLLPLLAGCNSGEASSEIQLPKVARLPAVTPSSTAAEREAIPLPMPTGERQIGVRLSEYRIEMTRETVPAGEVEFQVVNAGSTTHYLLVRSNDVYSMTPHLPPGDTAVMRVVLEPGEYEYICTIRDEFDHTSEGMRGQLVVR
jgi:plastocyanin